MNQTKAAFLFAFLCNCFGIVAFILIADGRQVTGNGESKRRSKKSLTELELGMLLLLYMVSV